MRIAVGSDHRGVRLKSTIVELLQQWGHQVRDVGTHGTQSVDYPDVARQVACLVRDGEVDRGVLICGTGLGMCIAANKVPGVRAAPCHDELTAELSRRHNDANVLCLSGEMLNEQVVQRLLQIWLETPFDGGRHARRVEKISQLERQSCSPAKPATPPE